MASTRRFPLFCLAKIRMISRVFIAGPSLGLPGGRALQVPTPGSRVGSPRQPGNEHGNEKGRFLSKDRLRARLRVSGFPYMRAGIGCGARSAHSSSSADTPRPWFRVDKKVPISSVVGQASSMLSSRNRRRSSKRFVLRPVGDVPSSVRCLFLDWVLSRVSPITDSGAAAGFPCAKGGSIGRYPSLSTHGSDVGVGARPRPLARGDSLTGEFLRTAAVRGRMNGGATVGWEGSAGCRSSGRRRTRTCAEARGVDAPRMNRTTCNTVEISASL